MLRYLGFRAICCLADALPRGVQYFVAKRVAELNYLLDRTARENVKANLRVILGDVPVAVLNRQARWVFRSFGMYLCEFFGFNRFGPQFVDEHVHVHGREHLDAALAAGRGAIFCSAHFANFELGCTVVPQLGCPVLVVAQAHADRKINALFVSMRAKRGVQVVHSERGASAALKAVRKNMAVALLSDRPTGGPVVPVTLFGRETYLPQGPWRIALATGAPLLPTFTIRRANWDYTFDIGAPLAIPATGTREEKITNLAQQYADRLEALIRTEPYQWAVFYRIWDDPLSGAKGLQQSLAEHGLCAAPGETAPTVGMGSNIEEHA